MLMEWSMMFSREPIKRKQVKKRKALSKKKKKKRKKRKRKGVTCWIRLNLKIESK